MVLIPNKYLETPHYKLERIKHDDPRLDDLQASYKMAEEVDTDVGYSKRKEEERKPRQEAVVKSITPDQPAPVVERRDNKSQKSEQASEGFFSRLLGFFRSKPAVESPTATGSKPKDRERGVRGGRGRNRAGRGRGRDKSDERPDSRENKEGRDTKKKELKEQRQPKPQRDQKEAREPKEGHESRRDRGNRQQRDDKRAIAAEEKNNLTIADGGHPVTPPPTTSLVASEQPFQADLLTNAGEEAATDSTGEPRRRRRRGGRNRNRRDRDQVDSHASENAGVDDSSAGMHAEHVESNTVEVVQQFIEHAHEPRTTSQNDAPVSVAESYATTPSWTSQPVETPTTTVMTEAPFVEHHVIQVDSPVHDHHDHQNARAEHSEQTTPEAAAPAPVVATHAPAYVAAPAPVSHATHQQNLEDVLKSAGLTMAVTNPEKLRQAQEASASLVPAPRVPRERKPAPPVSSEPLVQIETQR